LDGTEPTFNSPVYKSPVQFIDGGLVKAISFEGTTQFSPIKTTSFGLSKAGWSVYPATAATGNYAGNAIDDDIYTIWNTTNSQINTLPQEIAVDMGKQQPIKAFTYLPRQDKKTEGIVDGYSYWVSNDGTNWEKVAEGEFANIKSNPIEQLIPLSHAYNARYFKFTAKHVISGNGVAVAELGVKVN